MDIEVQASAAERALSELQQAVQVGGKESRRKKLVNSTAEQQKQIAQCERLAHRVKNAIESYRLELRALPREQQSEHQSRLRGLDESLRQARAQIDWKRMDADQAAAALSVGAPAGAEAETAPMTLEQAVTAGNDIQDASKASVARSLGMALQAEQVGIATLGKMNEQDEQMARISGEVDDIQANIARSRKLVGQIASGAARNRCIQVLCLLITVTVLVAITLAATGKDGGELNVPDAVRQGGQD